MQLTNSSVYVLVHTITHINQTQEKTGNTS